jgi:hypothetical protein
MDIDPQKEAHPSTDGDCSSEITRKRKNSDKTITKIKNETKNIPKNFGKGIISFIEKN